MNECGGLERSRWICILEVEFTGLPDSLGKKIVSKLTSAFCLE